jgi:hypothetical protein
VTSDSIDQHARDDATDALAKLATHEAVCAERYKNLDIRLASGSARMEAIDKGQKTILSILAWSAALTMTTLLAATGWLTSRLADIALK